MRPRTGGVCSHCGALALRADGEAKEAAVAVSVDAYLEQVAQFFRDALKVIDGRMPLLLGGFPRDQWFATVLLARAYHYYFAACHLYPHYAEPCAGVCRVVIEMADKIHYHIRECGSDGYDGFRTLDMPIGIFGARSTTRRPQRPTQNTMAT